MACFWKCTRSLAIIIGTGIGLILMLYIGFSIAISIPASVIIAATQIPDISRAYNYVPASMTVREISLSPAYCCHLVCFCTEVDDGNAELCRSMQNRSESLIPSQCASALPNSSAALCPPAGAATVCNNGPYCCTSCNETCSTITPQPVCMCPCQQCSGCACCKRVEARLCRLLCDPCEKLHMVLDFKDRHGQLRTQNMDRNYTGQSIDEGRKFYAAHPANSTFLAFYKPDDPTVVHYSRGYAVRSWAIFVIFGAFPLFALSALITGLLFACMLNSCGLQDRVEIKVVIMNWVLWVGIIWPLLILLPILSLSYPTSHAKTQLAVCISVLICFGWLPFPLLWCNIYS